MFSLKYWLPSILHAAFSSHGNLCIRCDDNTRCPLGNVFNYSSYRACGSSVSTLRDTIRIYYQCPSRFKEGDSTMVTSISTSSTLTTSAANASTNTSETDISTPKTNISTPTTKIPSATTPRPQVDSGELTETQLILILVFVILLIILIIIIIVLIIRYHRLRRIKLEISRDGRTML